MLTSGQVCVVSRNAWWMLHEARLVLCGAFRIRSSGNASLGAVVASGLASGLSDTVATFALVGGKKINRPYEKH